MNSFEYRVVYHTSASVLEAALNEYGRGGWEAYASGYNDGTWWVQLKRSTRIAKLTKD